MLAKLYKLAFDISVCYTIGAFLLKYFSNISISIGGYLILLLTVLVSIFLQHKKKWEILGMILIPIGSLALIRPSISELVLFLLIWAYYAFVTITERFVTGRGEFVDMLRRFAYLFLLPAILMFIDINKFSSYVQAIGPYLSATLVSATFLLRHLRAVNQMEQIKLYRRQQLMELMIFLGICLLLTLAKAPQNLAEGLILMYQYLLRPVLTFLGGVIGMIVLGVIYLFYAVIGILTNKKEIQNIDVEFGSAADKYSELRDSIESNVEWVKPFLYSISMVVVLVILYFFFRWLMGKSYSQKLSAGILEIREVIEDEKDKRVNFRNRRPKDSRAAVRYYYGKYMLWLLHKRVNLHPQDTTEEISDKYNRVLIEEKKEKREASLHFNSLYRRSRYQMAEQITTEEAEQAKKLYQMIKTSKMIE